MRPLHALTSWSLFQSLLSVSRSSSCRAYYFSSISSPTASSLLAMSSSSSSNNPSAEQKQERPYGSWESEITSQAITSGSVGLSGLKFWNNQLYWLEGRPKEGGRNVLCRLSMTDDQKVEDVSPKSSNIRTRVHEYGGAAVTFGTGDDKDIYVSEFRTQQLCRLKLITGNNEDDGDDEDDTAASCTPLTPDDQRFRFADGCCTKQQQLVCVREDHDKPKPSDVVNEVVSIQLDGNNDMKVLATGNDFYAAPRVSPDGTKVAYITWNHPNMPWDSTELRIATLLTNGDTDDGSSASPSSKDHQLIAGADGDTSILQPLWHPQTGDLYYLSDETGYYNIYRAGTSESILKMAYDFGGAAPGWSLGQQGFCFLNDGRLAASINREGKSVLLVADVVSKKGAASDVKEYTQDDGLPMQFGSVVCGSDGDLYFLGGSPSTPTSIFQWNLKDRLVAKALVSSSTLSFDDSIISVPKQIEFPTANDRTAFGYYYPPKNDAYRAPSTDNAPPLLVKAHGGPTACTGTSFNAGIQFWTSRGFAVLDVDYGGSTGYGREYRRRLRGSWGIVDVDDVCAGAKYLVSQGKADSKKLTIDGGSAGGFTTLSALAFRDVFQAGCSLYGIGDLTALAGDTHKFESQYLNGLVGKFPEDKKIYEERSPIESVDTLSCPILILQGAEDKVVPPNQAKMMYEALLKKGLPACLKIYEGEQHGFRKAENIQDALDSELAFYGKVFGIDVPGAIDLKIDNM